MPTAIALRSFDHNGRVAKGDVVTFDAITMAGLRRSGLVSKEDCDGPKLYTDGITEIPTEGTFLLDKAEKVVRPKAGKKSAASPAAPASLPPIVTPYTPGDLPPPPPVK